MPYPGIYGALYPTLGFPSAGTPLSLSQVFHPQALCLLTTSHLFVLFDMFAKTAIFLLALVVVASAAPQRFPHPTFDQFLLLMSVTAANLEVRHTGVDIG